MRRTTPTSTLEYNRWTVPWLLATDWSNFLTFPYPLSLETVSKRHGPVVMVDGSPGSQHGPQGWIAGSQQNSGYWNIWIISRNSLRSGLKHLEIQNAQFYGRLHGKLSVSSLSSRTFCTDFNSLGFIFSHLLDPMTHLKICKSRHIFFFFFSLLFWLGLHHASSWKFSVYLVSFLIVYMPPKQPHEALLC